MGRVVAINISPVKGIEKNSVERVKVIAGWGLEGDAHGGGRDRQVSILPLEAMEKVPPEKKEEVLAGGYTENFTICGIVPSDLDVGCLVQIGEAVVEISHIGKEVFKEHGRPYIVSREGRFGNVIKGGPVILGDKVWAYSDNEESFLKSVEDGNLTISQLFLKRGMSPDTRTGYNATALMLAARSGNAGIVRSLLEKEADVNAASNDQVTALMVAAYEGHAGIVEILLAAGADINARSESGLTALLIARQTNHNAVAQILEKAGARQ